jgi:hypothetical protein
MEELIERFQSLEKSLEPVKNKTYWNKQESEYEQKVSLNSSNFQEDRRLLPSQHKNSPLKQDNSHQSIDIDLEEEEFIRHL